MKTAMLLVSVIFSPDPLECRLGPRKAGLQATPIPRARTKNGVKMSREYFTTLPFRKSWRYSYHFCQKKARRIAWIIRWFTGDGELPLIFHLNFIVTFLNSIQGEGRMRVPMAFKPCLSVLRFAARLDMVLEGRRIASGASRGRKVRTPEGAMPRNPGLSAGYTRAEG